MADCALAIISYHAAHRKYALMAQWASISFDYHLYYHVSAHLSKVISLSCYHYAMFSQDSLYKAYGPATV